MLCKICQKEFTPNKYQPNQQVCSQLECQKVRQARNQQNWRLKNPDYFKCLGQEKAWQQSRHHYSKLWRNTHQEYLREYAKKRKEQRKEYMKDYMRRRRLQNSVNRNNI